MSFYRVGAEPRRMRGSAARSATDVDEHVGGRLRKRRVARGLSQDALAKILGVSFQQLHKYETGENRLSVSRLYQLCLVLDVPLDWFFEGLTGGAAESRHAADFNQSVSSYERASTVNTGEAMTLLRAFHKLRDPRMRELAISLVAMLAEKEAGGAGAASLRVIK